MMTQVMNDRIRRVRPGTPMGVLMRRYWHPLAESAQLSDENPTKEVRCGARPWCCGTAPRAWWVSSSPLCARRKANLSCGVPEPEGIVASTTARSTGSPAASAQP